MTRHRETGLGWPEAVAAAGAGRQEPPDARGGPPLEAALGFRLGRAHRLLRAAWEAEIADLELSPPQATLLRAIAQRPGCGLRELSRWVHTDAMNAKRLVDRLEQTGLAASSPDSGHRQRRALRLTARGAALAEELERRAAGHQRRLARLIGPAQTAQLLALLDHLELAAASGLPDLAAWEAEGKLPEGESQ